jgi:hypothetical protein
MWICLNDHVALLQAIAALIGIPIGLATVVMLIVTWRAVKRQSIAADRQAVAADRQAEAAENSANLTIQQIGQNLATSDKASEPLLRFDLGKHLGMGYIYNDGKGTAFDITVDYTDDFPRHARIVETFLAPQKQAQVLYEPDPAFVHGVTARYRSALGSIFETRLRGSEDGFVQDHLHISSPYTEMFDIQFLKPKL